MTKTIVHQARCERGVTLIDTMVVLAVMAIVGSMATMQMVTVRRALKGDGAMRVVMMQLTTAREMAIKERRDMEIQFVGDNWLQIIRHEVPSGTTVVANVALEGNARYALTAGAGDTPDRYGNSAPITFGTAAMIRFAPSGALVDGAGAPVNGTVFLSVDNETISGRAVTVLGAIGRVAGYRWNGRVWQRV
jgi:Tfp pilus assembly protein FimT